MPASRVIRRVRAVILSAAAVGVLAGCGDSPAPDREPSATPAAERHAMTVAYAQPRTQADALARKILRLGGLDGVASGFTETFDFPADVEIVARPGNGSPFYDPRSRSIQVPYGFVTSTADILSAGQPGITQTELGKQWAAVNDFIIIHEIGHAFVDIFDIPITGREEDAVDGMATTFMTDGVEGGAEYAFDAANFFHLLQGIQGAPDVRQFQDEHSLSVQRAYDIVCAVAGSSAPTMRRIAQLRILPPARLARCPAEYEQKSSAWKVLLRPHLR